MSNSTSNFTKFKILLRKNFLLQKARAWDLIVSLIFIFFISGIFLFLRYHFGPVKAATHIYEPIDLTKIPNAVFIWSPNMEDSILYSPKNDVYEAIVTATMKKLEIRKSEGFRNAKELDIELLKKNYLVGVKFPDSMSSYPKEFAFDLRFPGKLRTNSFGSHWSTNEIKTNIGGFENPYQEEGFLQIQNALVISYIEHEGNKQNLPSLKIQKYPEIMRSFDIIIVLLKVMPIFLALCYLYPTICIAVHVAQERETQIKEIMLIIGLQNWIHWLAWYVKSFVIMTIITITIAFLFCTKFVTNGAILIESNVTALLFMLLMYSVATIFFVFATVVCFKRTKFAVIINLLLFLLPMIAKPFVKGFYANIALCLVPHVVLMHIINFVVEMEDKNVGLKWAHLFRIYKTGTISPLVCLVMLLADTILFFILCLYIEQINTGEYGISKKWYFPFQREFWKKKSNDRSDTNFIGLSVKHLTKKFGGLTAVNDLSFDMYPNEITVLLGRSGAGKSTTILMLTGLLEPTSGTAFIHGHDIRTDMSGARKALGLCPQQNALFNDLTVKEHINFFSRVKGLYNKNDINAEIEKYTEIMELKKKKTTYAKNLSGGMKRKLCLCCALCGSPKVVLCDEPSSGVDPSARRNFWSLLQAEKPGKTILLTTHFMDEAEALADRIVIIGNGEHKYSGTIFDMKKRFGKGYCLVCDMQEDCIMQYVTVFLKARIPNITFINERGTALTYRLPPDGSEQYASLFRDLENNIDRLRLTGFGVSISTVEDVFTQMTSGREINSSMSKNNLLWRNFSIFAETLLISKTLGRKRQQIKGLFIKRALILRRSWILLLIVVLLPIILLLIVYLMISKSNITALPALPIEITSYDDGEVWLESPTDIKDDSSEKHLCDAYKAFATSFGSSYKFKNLEGDTFIEKMIDGLRTYPDDITKTVLVGATIKTNEMTAWLNPFYPHASPLTLNFLHNALAREYVNSDAKVRTTNAPLPFKDDYLEESTWGLQNIIILFLYFIIAAFIIHPINERVTGVKTQQRLSGVDKFSYWLTIFAVDFVIAMLIIIGMILIIICIGEDGYDTGIFILANLAILTFFVFAALPQIYVFSFIFNSVGLGFAMAVVCNIISYAICFILQFISRGYLLMLASIIIPYFNCDHTMDNIRGNNQLRKSCKILKEQFGEEVCVINEACCPIPDLFSVIDYPLIRFLLSLILYLLILFLLETQFVLLIRSRLTIKEGKIKGKKEEAVQIDEDVALEEERIKTMSNDERSKFPLVVDRISKYYCRFHAVRKISFLVKPRECFGLLGVNGAGKTSTFEMLTGNAWIDEGNAYCNGRNIRSLCGERIPVGYCPQNDCLFENLTGQENLHIYCLLHGIQTNQIRRLSNLLALKFDFIEHIHKETKNLSGGNKRKLCTIIAMIGNPNIIYLDEPSSGMDPLARRQLWYLVTQLREMGKPIVLTSHSMEECEALCTRLTIMVAGRLRCLGSTQHLKNKFSQGYILKINLITASEEDLKKAKENIKAFIASRIPKSVLQEEYDQILSYNISIQNMKYSEIFELMENNRRKIQIDDYTITQTSLDDIFIEFSKVERKKKSFIKYTRLLLLFIYLFIMTASIK